MRKFDVMLRRTLPLRDWTLTGFAALALCVGMGADWRGFRGSDSSGIADDSAPPIEWSATENIAWKKALPGRGLSGPIVVEDRVIVTASSGFRQDRLHVLCFDDKSGELLWERQFWATGQTICHPKMCIAT